MNDDEECSLTLKDRPICLASQINVTASAMRVCQKNKRRVVFEGFLMVCVASIKVLKLVIEESFMSDDERRVNELSALIRLDGRTDA
jgi:hypothetical protein